MKRFIPLLICLATCHITSAQYVYTIKADSVKLTNCDSTELIIENHTQGVTGGFLYNTGHGRTIFKPALTKVNNSLYLVGKDSLQIPGNAWLQGGNSFGTTGILGTKDNNHLDFYTGNRRGMRLDSLGNLLVGRTVSDGFKVDVTGTLRVTGYQMVSSSSDPNTGFQFNPSYSYITGVGASMIAFGITGGAAGSVGINLQTLGNIPQYSMIIGRASPHRYTTIVDYSVNPVFVVDGEGDAAINGGYFGIINGGTVSTSPDHGAFDFNINGPRGTGAGRTGDIILSTATSPGSGMTIHTMTNRWWLKGGTGYLANTSTPTSSIDVTGTTGYSQFRMRTSYTPTATADTNGNVGDFSWDGNYFYIKTPAGWKRSALTTF